MKWFFPFSAFEIYPMLDQTTIQIGHRKYEVKLEEGISIALQLDFNGDQPRFFDSVNAHSVPVQSGDFIGSVQAGGSCNVDTITANYHCNGTHTECVGHISEDQVSISNIIDNSLIPVTLISMEASKIGDESYHVSTENNNCLLTKSCLTQVLENANIGFLKGLVIRTLPNETSKKSHNYSEKSFPFFTNEAMHHIRILGVRHLLVDTPSVDRTDDGGELGNHRIYWGVSPGISKIDSQTCSKRTITEMIYTPDLLPDGCYLMNLQLPAFVSDAAPSRPILYPVNKINDH